MTFQQWLEARSIDAQRLTHELRLALEAQYREESERQRPPEHVLLLADDELWGCAVREAVSA